MSRARSIFNRRILSVGLFAVALAAAGAGRAQTPLPWHDCVNPCRITAEVADFEEGQAARLELHNKGDRPATAWLFFVDGRGEVVSERKASVNPGKTEAVNAFHPGGVNTAGLRAQFMVEEKEALIIFRPALRVFEKASGKTLRTIGPEGFKKSDPEPDSR